MSPIGWALTPLRKYAVFTGRAPRAEYWWYALFAGTISFLLGRLDLKVFGPPVVGSYGPLTLILVIAVVIPGFALTVRRLHDTGRTGWWSLIRVASVAIGLLGPGQIKQLLSGDKLLLTVVIVVFFVWICLAIILFVLMVSRGDEGANRYGPDPYGQGQLEEVFA